MTWLLFGGRRYNASHVQDDLWMVKRLESDYVSDNQKDWTEAQIRCQTSDPQIAIAAAIEQWQKWRA